LLINYRNRMQRNR